MPPWPPQGPPDEDGLQASVIHKRPRYLCTCDIVTVVVSLVTYLHISFRLWVSGEVKKSVLLQGGESRVFKGVIQGKWP